IHFISQSSRRTFFDGFNNELEEAHPQESRQVTQIQVADKGPLIVEGSFQITDKDGGLIEKMEKAALCRCGASQKKPFCDGSHKKIDFD
ncbi:MAG: CDGSH iron-sulfur domain-containing protein, partial [Bacteroidota bacterium]